MRGEYYDSVDQSEAVIIPDPGELALAHPEDVVLVGPQGVLEHLGVTDTHPPAQTPHTRGLVPSEQNLETNIADRNITRLLVDRDKL